VQFLQQTAQSELDHPPAFYKTEHTISFVEVFNIILSITTHL